MGPLARMSGASFPSRGARRGHVNAAALALEAVEQLSAIQRFRDVSGLNNAVGVAAAEF